MTAEALPIDAPPPPRLRRLPVPASEPPYDDELDNPPNPWHSRPAFGSIGSTTSGTGGVQGTLALAFVLPNGLSATPTAPPGLRLVPADDDFGSFHDSDGADRDSTDSDSTDAFDGGLLLDDFGPVPTPTRRLPEPRRWAGRFTQALVEVLAGDRPLAQLVRWTTPAIYDEVSGLVLLPDGTPRRATVRSVHVSRPDDGVAEVAVMVRRGIRTTAVALRIEGLDGRWQCTAMELG